MDYSLFTFAKEGTKKRKREKVSKDTYEKVLMACKGKCVLCGTTQNLVLHHILFRSEARDKIDDFTNCVMLCNKHHLQVHENKKFWQPILVEIRSRLEN